MADEPKEERPANVGDAITGTAALTSQLMKDFKLSFAQAWTIVKDGMDRQQHFQDNQVRLLLDGYKDVVSDDEELDEDLEAATERILTLVNEEGEVVDRDGEDGG